MKTLDRLLVELRQRDVQLWVEGDRLRYRAAKDSLTPELLAEVKNRKVEIVKFLHQATESTSSQLPPIVQIPRNGHLPLSFAQQRFWFLHQFEPDSSSNNMPVVVRFTGSLNVSVLEQSLQALVRRHEVLRTRFPSVDGQPTQEIAPDIDLTLPVIDLQQIPPEQRNAEALRLATEEARRPFDLGNGPILRLLLLRLSADEHLLVWNMHCMICDGASSDVFYRDLTALYCAFVAGKPSPLLDLAVQYVDFAHWQRQWLQGEVLESQLNYWKQKLEGTLPVIKLPTDRPRPPIVQTYRGDRGARMLPKSLNAALHSLSQKLGATQFMTLIAAFEILLHRYSQQKDILISFASAGRSQVETEGLVGFFSNTLIQRINFEGDPTSRELLDRVREASLEAYAHQDLPFEKLVEELSSEQSQSRSPLFQVKFALNPPWSNGRGMASVKLPDLTITSLFGYIYHGKTKYDLILVMREQDEGLGMVFDYNADLFDASTIARMLGHFETLLEAIVADPDRKVSELPLLTLLEQQQILHEWNADNIPIQPTYIHQWFEAQAERTPDTIAAIYKDEQLTYRELNYRANQLARHLQKLGAKPETPVGVLLERSPEAIVALLSVLKVGGVCVPLDPSDSPERLASILQETQIPVVLTQALIAKNLDGNSIEFVYLDADWETIQQQPQENLRVDLTADSLAAVLYPDNQTEQIKGISLTHKGIVQLAKNPNWVELNAAEVFLQAAPLSSDTAMFEIWGGLLNGGKLVISPDHSTSSVSLGQTIRQYRVTTAFLPTRLFHRMVDEQLEDLPSLRKVFVGGDWLSPSHVQGFRQWLPDSLLFNVYSIAENTGITCCYAATDPLPAHTSIPIGRAIANTQTYVLDQNRQLVPIGIVGELYIGGDRLARGYYNRPELTDAAFIANPFSKEPDARLFKTGDLVRYLLDGTLEFVARNDELVAFQGLQIENGRIEIALSQYPAIRESCVLVRQDPSGAESLVAFIVLNSDDRTVTSAELRNFLKQRLSSYMVPTTYVSLDALPLTPNGRIDRHALSNDRTLTSLTEKTIDPRDRLEQQLIDIWKKLLGDRAIGIHDNFFELGGNSLLSVRLVAEIEKTFNYYFPLSSFFQIGTIAEIARWIREKPSETISAEDLPEGLCLEDYRALLSHSAGRVGKHIGKRGLIIETSPTEMRSTQPFIWIGDINVSKKLGLQQPIYTMPANSWEPLRSVENYISAIASLLVDELVTVQPEGPYAIGAYCFEGLVAMEMARQLRQQGKEVALLALIDKYGPSVAHHLYRKLDWYSCVLRFELFQLSTLSNSLIDKWKYIKKRLQRRAEFALNVPKQGPELVEHQAITLLSEAANRYTPGEYSGNTVLIKSIKSDLSVGTKDLFQFDIPGLFPYFGWEGLLTGTVKTYKISCKHLEIYVNPYVEKLGNVLSKCLEEVR